MVGFWELGAGREFWWEAEHQAPQLPKLHERGFGPECGKLAVEREHITDFLEACMRRANIESEARPAWMDAVDAEADYGNWET